MNCDRAANENTWHRLLSSSRNRCFDDFKHQGLALPLDGSWADVTRWRIMQHAVAIMMTRYSILPPCASFSPLPYPLGHPPPPAHPCARSLSLVAGPSPTFRSAWGARPARRKDRRSNSRFLIFCRRAMLTELSGLGLGWSGNCSPETGTVNTVIFQTQSSQTNILRAEFWCRIADRRNEASGLASSWPMLASRSCTRRLV